MEILGLDIGGSGIKGAIVDVETGKLVSERHRLATPQPATPKAIAKTVASLIEEFNWIGPVGCSFPTVVLNGKCLSAGNISPKWVGTQIDQLFSEKCNGLPFYVGNDADLAGIAEMTQGAGRGKMGKVIMLTIGTGIGSGFFYNGVLIPNTELGRINGKKGEPVEYYAADSARKREELSLSKWAQRLDYYLNYIDRCFSPDFIILGGGVSKKYFKFSEQITVDVPIEVAHFANNAGIVGAAMYAHLNHKG